MDQGRIEVFTGPMFSGKTTRLMKALETLTNQMELPFILVKHSSDHRYKDEGVTSHNGKHLPALKTTALSSLEETIPSENFRIIGW